MTFDATVNPVAYEGGELVFIDTEYDTWNMDPVALEKAFEIYPDVKLVVFAHLYGTPAKVDEIRAICDKHGALIVEDAAESLGASYKGKQTGLFGDYAAISFNGNKMITTSGGGALITENEDAWREIMMYATQYRESYPYYQHEKIGYNYRMSNICAGIGRGQMTVANDHIAHHKHVQALYEELLKDVPGIHVHSQPKGHTESTENTEKVPVYDSNYWLCTITIDEGVKVKGQENAYKAIVTGAVGGAAGVIHAATSAHTDCEPNDNVEALRVYMDAAGIEARPLWKPMHRQPVYRQGEVKSEKLKVKSGEVVCQTSGSSVAYVNGVSEALFKVGMCLPAGPYVTDDDVRYIVETIKNAIE